MNLRRAVDAVLGFNMFIAEMKIFQFNCAAYLYL